MIVDFARELVKIENTYADELRNLASIIEHPVLRALFLSIAKDSEKHALMYEAVISVLTKTQPFISENDLKTIKNVIKKHIETEVKMLEKARQILESIDNPQVKLIAAAIVDDEGRHHRLLVNIQDKIAEIETLTENILWEMIWRDSPWHGTPGG